MVAKTLKSVKHASKLVSSVSDLYGKPNQYCDVVIQVGTTSYECHKLILALQSTYFQQCLYSSTSATSATVIPHITLADTLPEDFDRVLRYLYTGEIDVDSNMVGRLIRLVERLQLPELKAMCSQFIRGTLNTANCVQNWQVARDIGDSSLETECEKLFLKEFLDVVKLSRLQDIRPEMMLAAIEQDDLNVNSELEVCEILLKWFDANRQSEHPIRPFQLLSLVRWSGVDIEYIKSELIHNETLVRDRESFEFLSKVISYRLSGIQFSDLRTHHRPSTGLESCVVMIGVESQNNMTNECWRVSLQRNRSIALANVPTELQLGMVACNNNSSVYVTGLGAQYDETWRWDSMGGWTRGADIIQGRRLHCATFVNNTLMYALGGWVDSKQTNTSSVEQFNTTRNKWTTVGQLALNVHEAACVSYKTSIYMFGGRDKDDSTNKNEVVDCIQEYNTTIQQCTVLTQRLDQPRSAMRAVLWDTSVILMSMLSCLIFDLDHKTLQLRHKFTHGIGWAGLVLDNETLFVVGGETPQTDSNGKPTVTNTDEVRCIPVMDIINNKPTVTVKWTHHAKLKSPSSLHAYTVMTLANI